MVFLKKKQKIDGDHKILIVYGEVIGIFDVWEFGKVIEKLNLERGIAIVKKNPTQKVFEEAEKNRVEIMVSENPKEYAQQLKRKLEKPDLKIGVRKLEEVADRSIMQDPC